MKFMIYPVLFLSLAFCTGCEDDQPNPVDQPELRDIPFTNEELITIQGFTGNAMEVDITPDGQILMFNDRVEGPPDEKSMHWASRIDDTTFQYEGLVSELNTPGVDGTPSFDEQGTLYYTSTGEYFNNGYRTLYKAVKDVNGIYQPELMDNEGLYQGEIKWFSLDPDISNKGQYMFYSFMMSDDAPPPAIMDIRGAVSDGQGGFTLLDNSIFANINTDLLEYAPTISNDGLEMYFTRADQNTATIIGIFKTTRESLSEPFEASDTPVAAISGIVEAPSFNIDETELYYHRKVNESDPNDVYKIYRVTRELP